MRRLLHDLEDPVAMSRNRLVRDLFELANDGATFARVRAAVLEAVEMLRPVNGAHSDIAVHRGRQYEIVRCYDLGSESMTDVLHALCIERSQFYRERACALEWLCEWMQRYVKASFHEHGTTLSQLARLRDDPVERARCLLRMAEIHVDSDRNEARARAEEAVRLLKILPGA